MTTMPPKATPQMERCGPPGERPDALIPHGAPQWLTLQTDRSEASAVVAHISNIQYVRWLDRAAQLALESAGWTYADLLDNRTMFFVARHEIDYRGEAFPEESLFIATWVRDVRRVKSWRDTVIWRNTPQGPTLVCTASTLWVHVNLDSRKPCRIPATMVDALTPLQQDAPPWRERS